MDLAEQEETELGRVDYFWHDPIRGENDSSFPSFLID
jgi:hypothetical protein